MPRSLIDKFGADSTELRSFFFGRLAQNQLEDSVPHQKGTASVRYAVDGFFSFSYLPLRVLTYAGMTVSALGFVLGFYFIVKRLLGVETATTGFTTLVSLVTFLGGVQLIGIGVLGEYLGRVYDEVKQRPIYLIKPPRR